VAAVLLFLPITAGATLQAPSSGARATSPAE
jgi:hypothetical protein